ncbi:MCE family protein [Streptomyces griseoviridis]|jgi:phospholipid/cholesterol/gamma-HCH transport system substrate-binding protein|uniref:Phospholipid/cholesterol/gamma-HCH transport system substrate-binding protein n=3 Tax=Streptomyces TaxID=1883 RepID=A0ABT9LNU1_STRGD|nr:MULTISPECIES: MCE family protein [Streptomyces]MDP9685208.1 phospholipid/cholesterol/gamma-HCH transport system substrate-binding protein [Streptomyces griseoviridis]GGS41846.1 ABC transporter substrate-binding protein [Streptomyces niveoruber]GGS95517.1 ABC transporter substrate-binding protein [Streptomyces griseoviridis]GGU32078.1 ABC transporter substrate-binding protein [Streptomyces daghestanicus]GHI32807.1 ABC transporter substrate-binding protein [Streptomyces daghestanicus]
MSAPRGATVRRRFAGVVFLVVPVLLVWLAVAVYDKQFTDSDPVTVETGSVGNEMHLGAEVKLRGVVVGEVRAIDATADGARLTLALKPGARESIPADVTAQMLPTTLFGERFVALVPPASPAAEPLAAGAVIPQDRSANAVELQQVLDNVLPMLTAVQPQKLSATLSAVSRALEGRGDRLGDTLALLDDHLRQFNPHLPTLNRDLKELVKVSQVYADAAPDILTALTDFTTTSSTLAEKESELAGTLGATTRTAEDVTAFLRQNKDNIIRLSAASRPTLDLLAEYSPAFPCTLRTLADFVPAMDKALGKGTDRPGLRVDITTVPSRGAYRPGTDTPSYDAGGGPRCYPVPYLGVAAEPAVQVPATAGQDLGPANSPQENDLVNELLAPAAGQDPADLPEWSSLLVGPALRGTEVTLR